MNIYVASSWRNRFQPGVVERLRAEGHTVYDFRNPAGEGENTGFGWQQLDPNWKNWTPAQYRLYLTHATAQKGFESDERGMIRADACVLVMPSGRSAHVEFGWMVGRGKLGYVLLSEEGFDPDFMYLLVPHRNLCLTLDELVQKIKEDAGSHDDELMADYSPRARPDVRRLTLRSSSANPTFSNLSKKLDGSPASPPVMPHVVTSPQENVAGGIVIEGGVCNLKTPLPALVKMFKFYGAAGGPEPGDEYNVVSLSSGRGIRMGSAADCRTTLIGLGYEPASLELVAAVGKRYTLAEADEVWVHDGAMKQLDEWFASIRQYLP